MFHPYFLPARLADDLFATARRIATTEFDAGRFGTEFNECGTCGDEGALFEDAEDGFLVVPCTSCDRTELHQPIASTPTLV
jgi:hypothetical protein